MASSTELSEVRSIAMQSTGAVAALEVEADDRVVGLERHRERRADRAGRAGDQDDGSGFGSGIGNHFARALGSRIPRRKERATPSGAHGSGLPARTLTERCRSDRRGSQGYLVPPVGRTSSQRPLLPARNTASITRMLATASSSGKASAVPSRIARANRSPCKVY